MSGETLSRDELLARYLDQLPYAPYPVQEDALLKWFTSDHGVLVCAPTGTGKTLIAEAAAYEALQRGDTMYYTTPLIALTEQKFRELQASAVRWGFQPEDVGLVTGNRRVNPDARVLVVVAEILLNRLLHHEEFDFKRVSSVVMDEFHNFSDPERGLVWEFSLALLPAHVRLLLLSATVGNAYEFTQWVRMHHHRDLELAEGHERRVPLLYQWVGDELLGDYLESMAQGDEATRRTPALVFCFNRDDCWSIAEELKGRHLISDDQQAEINAFLAKQPLGSGAGNKLKSLLQRGIGVHHAGILPKYKRVVEELFQKKLLSFCICTETLAAGINLPARSVVLPSLMKGPPGRQKVIDPSSAHQIFGRAGRPQFDSCGYVFALPHEDDVKLLRWKEKFDRIPENTKDPVLLSERKALKKKMPTRSSSRQYWNEQQFDKVRTSPPGGLASRGPLTWRLLAYLLRLSPEIEPIRKLLRQRLMDAKQLELADKLLDRMLLTLHAGDYVTLDPPPPAPKTSSPKAAPQPAEATPEPAGNSWLSQQLQAVIDDKWKAKTGIDRVATAAEEAAPTRYRVEHATPTARLNDYFVFRSVNPLYAMFLIEHLAIADPAERLQLFESVLELPGSIIRFVRVPPPKHMPPGRLALEKVDQGIVDRGIMPADDLYPEFDPSTPPEERKYAPPLADKVKMLFDSDFPDVHDVSVNAVWCAGELLKFGGNFANFVSARDLVRQEGLVFRHVLRLILMLGEFRQVTPPGLEAAAWQNELDELAQQLTDACHGVDAESTNYMLAHAKDYDVVEPVAATVSTMVGSTTTAEAMPDEEFGLGLDISNE